MLLSLHIENVAVIKSADIDFTNGFTAMTGQTGAGKSVILDCINLILGAKADRELIRHSESQATVSAVFDKLSPASMRSFAQHGYDVDEEGKILIQRQFSSDGRSSIRINGRAATVSILKSVAPTLVSIHGQNDTNSLADPAGHILLVDTFAGIESLLSEYRTVYLEYEQTRAQIRQIKQKALEGERLREILEYQIKDIDSAHLHPGEEEELVEKKAKIRNSEKISKNAEFVYKALRGSEKGSVAYLVDRSIGALSTVAGVLPHFTEYAEKLRDILYQVEDIAEEVYAVLDDLDGDPTDVLNNIESRLDKISKLKRKYGLTVDDVLEFRARAFEELSQIENSADLIRSLELRASELYCRAKELADQLHNQRLRAISDLESDVKKTLEFLDMPKVVFFASVNYKSEDGALVLNEYGYDIIEFYLSANLGADAQPMSKIASGGELARVMLALKGIISDKDGVSTVIFDEIDAGVSGKTARKIGFKMLELSRKMQLICVTHSAQIASLAEVHFLISKSVDNSSTETHVEALDFEGRVNEISRILGGLSVTESQRRAALDMINEKGVIT